MFLFSKLARSTFVDKDFRQLSSVWTRMLWLYLVSSPKNTSLPGLMMLSFEEMMSDLAWESELGPRARAQLEDSLRELQEQEWIVYHRENGMLLAPRLFDANVPANPSVVAHWKRMLLDMPRNVLVDIWARMARRKFRDLDRLASERPGGKAWRLDTLEEFLADIDDCYSPPSVVDYDLITEEDRKYILVPANPTKARVYPPLSSRKRKPKAAEAEPLAIPVQEVVAPDAPDAPDAPEDECEPPSPESAPEKEDHFALLSAAFENGADVVSPTRETSPKAESEGTEKKRKSKIKADMRERVSPEVIRLVDFFQKRMREDKPDCKLPDKSTLDSWYYYMDLILTRDKRDFKEVRLVIAWVTQDDFEKANVRCPRKLRERYDQLAVKMLAAKAKIEREQEQEKKHEEGNYSGEYYAGRPVREIQILVPPPQEVRTPEQIEKASKEQHALLKSMWGEQKYNMAMSQYNASVAQREAIEAQREAQREARRAGIAENG